MLLNAKKDRKIKTNTLSYTKEQGENICQDKIKKEQYCRKFYKFSYEPVSKILKWIETDNLIDSLYERKHK